MLCDVEYRWFNRAGGEVCGVVRKRMADVCCFYDFDDGREEK